MSEDDNLDIEFRGAVLGTDRMHRQQQGGQGNKPSHGASLNDFRASAQFQPRQQAMQEFEPAGKVIGGIQEAQP